MGLNDNAVWGFKEFSSRLSDAGNYLIWIWKHISSGPSVWLDKRIQFILEDVHVGNGKILLEGLGLLKMYFGCERSRRDTMI